MKESIEAQDMQRLVDVLASVATGKGKAKTARQLRAFGFSSDRYLRVLVHRANAVGYLVCADNAGYFIPETADEARETVMRLRSQATEMQRRATRIESLATKRFTQPALPMSKEHASCA